MPELPVRAVPKPFPWDEAMAFGFGVLRLSSKDFWNLTPRELQAAVEGVQGRRPAAPFTRKDFASLMQAYPDVLA